MPQGPGSATHVPILKRAVVLALNWHAGLSFKVIAEKVKVNEGTVRRIVKRAKERAADKNDFDDVLGCLTDVHGGGREARFPEGGRESMALAELSQKDEEHWQMPFLDIAKELNIFAARSTLEKVFHDHHNLFRRKATHKPFLTYDHIEARLAFAHMALRIAIEHIIFTDEMWVEFNSTRRRTNVTRKRGADPNEWALHDKQDDRTIRVMFWGAICLGHKGPCHVWEK
ncbi:hypothetical protein HOY82DRAFT_646266, partial [Tuber indicum]